VKAHRSISIANLAGLRVRPKVRHAEEGQNTIVYNAGIFHIATAVWKYFIAFIKLVILGLRQIRRELRNLLDEIANAPARRRRKGGLSDERLFLQGDPLHPHPRQVS
jgi:hypothetical protein